jgi:hypothetical protein
MTLQRTKASRDLPPPTPPSATSRSARNTALPIAPQNVAVGARQIALGAGPTPTTIACLRCQLVGKRQLTCSKADACAELPQSFILGPLLLAGWLVTAIAFVVAVM